MEKKQIMEKLMEAMKQSFDERQQKPFQYVVAYYRVKDDSLIGYHASSFCQLTDRKESGKRYNGEDPYEQLKIIRKNLDSTLRITEESAEKKIFGKIDLNIKNNDFGGLNPEEVWINAEYLDEGIPPQRFEYHIIDKDDNKD